MGHEIAFLTSRFAVNKKHERQPMKTRIQHKIKVLLQRSYKLSLKPFHCNNENKDQYSWSCKMNSTTIVTVQSKTL